MKNITEMFVNENGGCMSASCDCLNNKCRVPFSGYVFVVYGYDNKQIMVWCPDDEDELATLLMRNMDFDHDAAPEAKKLISSEVGKTTTINAGKKYMITHIR